jgi:hypothetical protein
MKTAMKFQAQRDPEYFHPEWRTAADARRPSRKAGADWS